MLPDLLTCALPDLLTQVLPDLFTHELPDLLTQALPDLLTHVLPDLLTEEGVMLLGLHAADEAVDLILQKSPKDGRDDGGGALLRDELGVGGGVGQ